MKSTSLLFVLLLAFFSTSFGQKSLLWEVSGKGIKPSYLFGTIHVICADEFVWQPNVQEAFAKSGRLVIEVNTTDPQVMQKVQGAAINKNFRNFKGDLADTDRLFLDSCLTADLKVGIDKLGILKPWALMTFYSLSLSYDCTERKQYEAELVAMAKTQNKPIGELETFEFQLSIFDSIPMQKQLDWLMKTVREKDKGKASFAKILAAYKDQDVELLNKLTMDDEDMKQLADQLFFKRNENWIPAIAQTAKEQTTFFAFGAGHLGGKGGVLDLLSKNGYKVKPVKSIK